MEGALTALLLAHAPLAALVGGRVHWLRLPEGVAGWPYVICQVISAPHDYHFGGETDLRQARVQVDVWAESLASAVAVGGAITGLMSAYRGLVAGCDIRGCFVIREGDSAGVAAGAERQLFRRSMDLEISWKMEV